MRYRINNTIKTIHTITSPNITIPTEPTVLMASTVKIVNIINVSINIVSSIILVISLHYRSCFLRVEKKIKERAEAQSFGKSKPFFTKSRFILIPVNRHLYHISNALRDSSICIHV